MLLLPGKKNNGDMVEVEFQVLTIGISLVGRPPDSQIAHRHF